MIMRSEKVPESPSSALQTMYFCSAVVPSTVFHLMPVGKAAPPRPRRPDVRHRVHDRAPGPCASALREAAIAAVRDVVVERDGIGDADAREGEALLLREVGMLLGEAERERVRLALEESGVEQAGDVGGVDRAVGDAAGRRLHLDQRLEPEQAARAVAHQVHVVARAPRPRWRWRGPPARRRPRARRSRAGRRPGSWRRLAGRP